MAPFNKQKLKNFQKTVWKFYTKEGRHSLPWRLTKDPYKILVSEIMLQQTQVSRVIVKYESFLKKFPTVEALAKASLNEVLKEWQGLGYNRRGVHLKQCTEKIAKEFKGKFPRDLEILVRLPGVGPTTAADLRAFAWNLPGVAIETNIRSAYIDAFFPGETCKTISDKEIIPIIEQTLDNNNPREWYYALMDYGAFIKKSGNPNIRSKHYVKQSAFKGSNREKRSQILKLILEKPRNIEQIKKNTSFDTETIKKNVEAMQKEGLIKVRKSQYLVA